MSEDPTGEDILKRFGPLLKEYVQPSHLLPSLGHIKGIRSHFNKIFQMERQGHQGDGVQLLVSVLLKSGQGWYQSFLEALEVAGYEYVLKVIVGNETIKNQAIFQNNINIFLKEINIRPSDLLTDLVVSGCINDKDKEAILAVQQNEGDSKGTMILLDAVTRKKEHWFSDLMYALMNAGYREIVEKIAPDYLSGDKSGQTIQHKMEDLYSSNEQEPKGAVLSHHGQIKGQPDVQILLMDNPSLMSQDHQNIPMMPRELPDGESDSLLYQAEAPKSASSPKITAVIRPLATDLQTSDAEAQLPPAVSRVTPPSWQPHFGDAGDAGSSPEKTLVKSPIGYRQVEETSGERMLSSSAVNKDLDDLLHGMKNLSTDMLQSSDNEDEDEYYPAAEDIFMEEGDFQELKLRNYQMELAKLAVEGKNVIVNAPTGSGKTLVALKIALEHLQNHDGIKKVIFLVPTVSLVEQQLKMFKKYRELSSFSSYGISGDSQAATKVPLGLLLDQYDIFVCTAQILVDAMKDRSVESVSRFSLVIFDECHHTMKGHPYNKIMCVYLDEKYSKDRIKLPQIVGLTASVGTGKSTTIDKTKDHILTMCANLDAFYIATVKDNVEELQRYSKKPRESTVVVKPRSLDPFYSVISRLMSNIEFKMKTAEDIGIQASAEHCATVIKEVDEFRNLLSSPPPSKREQYTQWLSKAEKEAVCISSPKLKRIYISCIDHLKVYNRALNLNADCRTLDGYEYIDGNLPNLHGPPHGDETDLYLDKLYKVKETELKALSGNLTLKNPKLEALKLIIMENYKDKPDSRVIVFAKTRELTVALQKWMEDSRELERFNPERLTGSQASAADGGMTGNQQTDVLQYFKDGKHQLLIATSVAEEGLDVSKCNLVIRYLHVTNEISRVQTMGRGRADDAIYVVVAEEGSGAAEKERLNEVRQTMMRMAMNHISHMSDADVIQRIEKFQRDMKTKRRLLDASAQKEKDEASQNIYMLHCMKCDKFVCYSIDLRKIEDSHHVVIDEDFKDRVDIQLTSDPVSYGRMGNFEKSGKLYCGMCRREKGDWGIMAIYIGASYPVLKISSFIIKDTDGNKFTCKKWKDVPFRVSGLTTEDIEKRIEYMPK